MGDYSSNFFVPHLIFFKGLGLEAKKSSSCLSLSLDYNPNFFLPHLIFFKVLGAKRSPS